ncbi:MAG: glycosyltransferase family 4 protein, partial [Ornithinimicrobium sp.]
VVIPNGVDVGRFAGNHSPRSTQVNGAPGPTIAFLGRYDEPRKGLRVLLDAVEPIAENHPGLRVLIAGPGNTRETLRYTSRAARAHCEFLGPVSEAGKVELLSEADLYVAPNTGGESFGIVLIEAMASGVPVAASDLPAFTTVLDAGNAGALFRAGESADLARVVTSVLSDRAESSRLSAVGRAQAARYDWSHVGPQILAVYDSVRPRGSVVSKHRQQRVTHRSRRVHRS